MSVRFSKRVPTQDSLSFVLDWAQALNGNKPLSDVLLQLMKLSNADAALIARTSMANGRIRHIARCNSQEGKVWPSQPQTQAELVMGDCISSAKAGSVWKQSEMMTSEAVAVSRYKDRKPGGLLEVIVVPLEANKGHVDHLELHYNRHPNDHDLDLLVVLAPTLASGWGKRTPGSISARFEQAGRHLLREVREERRIPILDPKNPANLSRCEFRVCAMMKEGMTVKLISDTLSVCPATIRSHLSSIFSKTGASNQVELLHLLNRKTEPACEIPARARA